MGLVERVGRRAPQPGQPKREEQPQPQPQPQPAEQPQPQPQPQPSSSSPTSNAEVWGRIARDIAGGFIKASADAAQTQFGLDGNAVADILRNLADEFEDIPL